jgi:sulfite reductase beta subunit-like hemoprotein
MVRVSGLLFLLLLIVAAAQASTSRTIAMCVNVDDSTVLSQCAHEMCRQQIVTHTTCVCQAYSFMVRVRVPGGVSTAAQV